MRKNSFVSIEIEGNKKAQEIMSFFKKKAKGASELARIEIAQELCEAWRKERISFLPPAVPSRKDYWYLAQLFFMDRHVHLDGKPYKIDLAKTENILIDSFEEKDYQRIKLQKGSLLSLLLPKEATSVSRQTLNKLIKKNGSSLLLKLGFDPKKFKITPVPFDIYIRLAKKMNLGKHILNTFFDGYRLRTDGKITSLFGGNKLFGGSCFIDSIWNNTVNNSIITRLVIVRKDYGN